MLKIKPNKSQNNNSIKNNKIPSCRTFQTSFWQQAFSYKISPHNVPLNINSNYTINKPVKHHVCFLHSFVESGKARTITLMVHRASHCIDVINNDIKLGFCKGVLWDSSFDSSLRCWHWPFTTLWSCSRASVLLERYINNVLVFMWNMII